MLGHFLPWYTIRGRDYPLSAEMQRGILHPPQVEDWRHWRDARSGYRRTHLHLPEVGMYDSRDPEVIAWQIGQATRHGVAGFIVNWYGTNSVENLITLHWLRGLDTWNRRHPDQPFTYFVSFDSQASWPSEGKVPVSMEEDFRYIRDALMTDAYLCRDGRPVFSVFPYENDCPRWRSALDRVFGPGGADLIWMNGCAGGGESSAYPWVRVDDEVLDHASPYVWRDPDNAGDKWLESFYRRANEAKPVYLMGGVWPGFDDQLVSWAWNREPENPRVRPRVICRETSRGNTLDLTWDAYLGYLRAWSKSEPWATAPAPLVQLVTWNDYAEASTVEPTRDYGCGPLEICMAKMAEARRIWASSEAAAKTGG